MAATKLSNLRGWSTNRIVEVILQTPSLTHLDLSDTEFNNQDLERIFSAISNYPMTHIDMFGCRIEKSGLKVVAEGIKNMATLTHLILGSTDYDLEGVTDIINLISDGKFALAELWWCDSGSTKEQGTRLLLEAIRHSPSRDSIQTLNVTNGGRIKREDEVTIAAANIVNSCNSLRRFGYDWGPQPSYDVLATFFRALKYNKSLQFFGAYREVPAQLLDDCFEGNSTITETDGYYIPPRYALVNLICNELKASEMIRKSIPKTFKDRSEIVGFVKEMTQPVVWNSIKLIVLGHGRIGKTTLVDALKSFRSLKKYFKTFGKITSTVGMDLSEMSVGKGEVTIFDFAGQLEYTVTHQFLLSNEMVVYIVGFDLSIPQEKQEEQIAYWLSFLNSSLPSALPTTDNTPPKWQVIVVGLKADQQVNSTLTSNLIPSWQKLHSNLPLHTQLFRVSSMASTGVKDLLATIEVVCNQIFSCHTRLVPLVYQKLCKSLRKIKDSECILSTAELHATNEIGMGEPQLVLALKYLHAIGRVLLKGDMVCTNPQVIPKLAALFVSPKEVRSKLFKKDSDRVELLEDASIGVVVGEDIKKLRSGVALLEDLGVCFQLLGPKLTSPAYLFPSLASQQDQITFSDFEEGENGASSCKGIRFAMPDNTQLIFVPGFFCQLIVLLLESFNISKRELLAIHSNGVLLSCGMFNGELIMKIEPDARSISLVMFAPSPDLDFPTRVFKSLVARQFTQYDRIEQQLLCPFCVDAAFRKASLSSGDVGLLELSECEKQFQYCNAQKRHKISNFQPPPKRELNSCKTHTRTHHDFFLNYRVATEGKKSPGSTESDRGFVELIYERLSTRKLAKKDESVFVFWDHKCLNIGQDWEFGFMYGLTHSKVVVLLISSKTLEGISANAPNKQDNLRYECALIQNALNGTPVFPVFVSETKADGSFEAFDFPKAKAALPDSPHARDEDAQSFIDELSHTLNDKKKRCLTTVAKTVNKLFKLQGNFLAKRGEDKSELDKVIESAMEALEANVQIRS